MQQETNNTTETVEAAHEMVGTTLSIPVDLWRGVKNLATDRRVSAQSIWIEAMRAYLKVA